MVLKNLLEFTFVVKCYSTFLHYASCIRDITNLNILFIRQTKLSRRTALKGIRVILDSEKNRLKMVETFLNVVSVTALMSSYMQVIFLEKRENSFTTATLITTGSNGSVRAWSVCGGGLLGHFTAAQGDHDSVLSMTTNHDNTILVTGDTAGFVKVTKLLFYLCNQ